MQNRKSTIGRSSKKAEKDIPKTNRLGLPPPKRIDVANTAVADELLTAQKLLYLQQDDYYKAQYDLRDRMWHTVNKRDHLHAEVHPARLQP